MLCLGPRLEFDSARDQAIVFLPPFNVVGQSSSDYQHVAMEACITGNNQHQHTDDVTSLRARFYGSR